MPDYIQRSLTLRTDGGETQRLIDANVLDLKESVIILAEPGMGKTLLLTWLSKQAGWTFRSAAAFVCHPEPQSLVPSGASIVIDGLDELAAARESDPVNRVLAQLIKAGWPRFVLSCRSADWRGASARQDIAAEYGAHPRELTLEPFTRDDAVSHLASSLGRPRAKEVIDCLEEKGIPDLYGNPLTLTLFAEVAARDRALPGTKAELLRRAVEVMWNERNDRHDRSPLSDLDEQAALAAAGAVCAAYILTGASAIAVKPETADVQSELKIAEIKPLPGGKHVRTIIGSRLFNAVPGRLDCYKPIHRIVAEFLGARWLASQARDEQARERMLAMMTRDSGVPASLRGIHAWLAQDDAFAPRVIAVDPYGMLRYGDADGLGPAQGRALLEALLALQESDPYFRAQDWAQHSAKGLAHPELQAELGKVLMSSKTGLHLRTLLLGAIRGCWLGPALVEALWRIVMGDRGHLFCYAERADALRVLTSLEGAETDWPAIVNQLVGQGGENARRLALNLMDELGFERFTPAQIVHVILARLDLVAPTDDDQDADASLRLYGIARRLPEGHLAIVLDLLAASRFDRDIAADYHTRKELGDLIYQLIGRYVELETPDPMRLLAWLRVAANEEGYARDDRKRVNSYFSRSVELRRAIQHHVIFKEVEGGEPWQRIFRLQELSHGLAPNIDDVIHLLAHRGQAGTHRLGEEQTWRELAGYARHAGDRAEEVLAAASPFAEGQPDLLQFLDSLRLPRPRADWELEQERRRAIEEEERTAAWAEVRNVLAANLEALRSGELRYIRPVALAYFARYRDIDESLPGPDRVEQYLGVTLCPDAMEGLDAVLFRSDLPSATEVADNYAKGRRWNVIDPMIAAAMERVRRGARLEDINVDVLIATRLGLAREHVEDDAVAASIDELLRRTPAYYEQFVRLLIEPDLRERPSHVSGLHEVCHGEVDRELAVRLAFEWLRNLPNLPSEVEGELIHVLAQAGHFTELEELGRERLERGFGEESLRRLWWAVGVFGRFEISALGTDSDIGLERDLLWEVRPWLRETFWKHHPHPGARVRAIVSVVGAFRSSWPKVESPSSWSGDTNPWDASQFILEQIRHLSTDVSNEAVAALDALKSDPEDDYTPDLRHASVLQRHARREADFSGVTLNQLRHVVRAEDPVTGHDLAVVLRYALRRLQAELRGNDTDTVAKYWSDNQQPRGEDNCTDRLIEDLMRLLPPFGITRVPQADMPSGKKVDVLFTVNGVAVPVECKGQWNRDLWTAAEQQLDALYLRDSRTQGPGIYLIYWFGPQVNRKYALKDPPADAQPPTSPDELREQIIERLSPAKRGQIIVEVLDFTQPGT